MPRLDKLNARKHSDRNKKAIRQSLEAVGAGRSILLDADDNVLAGNGVLEQAEAMGIPLRVVETNGAELVAVKRIDLTGDKARQAATLDNIVADTSAFDYDAERLRDALENDPISKAIAEQDERLRKLLGNTGKQETADAGALVDKAQELQNKWQVQRGDLWQCGKHRILCGDSTNADDVARVMQGERADFGFADPPYNLGIKYGKETNDNKAAEDYFSFCLLFYKALSSSANVVCITPGIANQGLWYQIEKPKWAWAWVKMNGQSRNAFGGTNKWEPVLFWNIPFDRGIDVFDANNDYSESIQSDGAHPVAKPPNLMRALLERFCKNIAIDVFNGAGTTLVACEQTGRIGRGIEIEPKYVAVTLERLSLLGLMCERIAAQ